MMIHTCLNHSIVFLRKSNTFILVYMHSFIYIYTVAPTSIAQLVQIAATFRVCGGYKIMCIAIIGGVPSSHFFFCILGG